MVWEKERKAKGVKIYRVEKSRMKLYADCFRKINLGLEREASLSNHKLGTVVFG